MSVSLGVATLVAVAGCGSPLVEWGETTSAPADTVGGLTVSISGTVGFARPARPPRGPVDTAGCEQSIVAARDAGLWYAAWYRRRPDGSITVVAARSADSGRTWSPAGVVDSLDRGSSGCSRPGPSIAVSDGYVHIAYSLQASEGFGVFFAHTMDSTRTFHSAVPVIYGDRLTAVAVAADGADVAVAYEDPGGTGHRVDLALSRTQGHSFEPRVRVSPDEMSALAPEVAIRGSAIALSFVEPGGGRIMRVGHIH